MSGSATNVAFQRILPKEIQISTVQSSQLSKLNMQQLAYDPRTNQVGFYYPAPLRNDV